MKCPFCGEDLSKTLMLSRRGIITYKLSIKDNKLSIEEESSNSENEGILFCNQCGHQLYMFNEDITLKILKEGGE